MARSGLTVTVTGNEGVSGARHGLLPALAGALLVAAEDVTTTCAVSIAPRLSVTTSCSVTLPEPGACSRRCEPFAPFSDALPLTTDHAKPAMLRPQAAALVLASSVIRLPALTLGGRLTAAIGRCACWTAPSALAMPAPQVAVVQLHSMSWELSLAELGTWHIGAALLTGKGLLAPCCRRAISCAGLRFALTDSISPAMPETIGAEKLVPRLVL